MAKSFLLPVPLLISGSREKPHCFQGLEWSFLAGHVIISSTIDEVSRLDVISSRKTRRDVFSAIRFTITKTEVNKTQF